MKKMLAALLAVILLCGCFAGCSLRDRYKYTYTFTDDLGRTVSVQRQPEKVAALLGSFAQAWHLAGGQVAAACNDAFEDLKVPKTKETVNLGSTKWLSLDLLLEIRPDFVLASVHSVQHLQWKDELEKEKIPVAYFDGNSFESYLRMLKICTDLTGAADRYETYGSAQQAAVDAVRSRAVSADGPRVLVLRASATAIRAKRSSDTVAGVILRDLGCVNVADTPGTFANYDHVTMDEVVALDPDFIFVIPSGNDQSGMEEHLNDIFGKDPRWTELTAVKNSHAHLVDKRMFQFKPNDLWVDAYQTMETYLFGE